jgi:hypothetical protein
MKKAIWFSRHQPSAAQIEDAAHMGYALTITPEGTSLGAMDLRDNPAPDGFRQQHTHK